MVVMLPDLADLPMALAAHIFTSGSVGMMASPGGGSELSADSCFFAVVQDKGHYGYEMLRCYKYYKYSSRCIGVYNITIVLYKMC